MARDVPDLTSLLAALMGDLVVERPGTIVPLVRGSRPVRRPPVTRGSGVR